MNFVDTLLKKLLPFQVFKKRFLINGARPSPLQTDLHNKLVERRLADAHLQDNKMELISDWIQLDAPKCTNICLRAKLLSASSMTDKVQDYVACIVYASSCVRGLTVASHTLCCGISRKCSKFLIAPLALHVRLGKGLQTAETRQIKTW